MSHSTQITTELQLCHSNFGICFLQLNSLNTKLLKCLSIPCRIHLGIKTNDSFPKWTPELPEPLIQDYIVNRVQRKKEKNKHPKLNNIHCWQQISLTGRKKKTRCKTPKKYFSWTSPERKQEAGRKQACVHWDIKKNLTICKKKILPLKTTIPTILFSFSQQEGKADRT